MGKYDSIFNSEEASTPSLSPEESVAAIAVIATLSEPEVSEVDIDYLVSLLLETGVFDDNSEEEMSQMVDKLLDIAEEKGLGTLFNAAYDSLSDELWLDAFAAGVIIVVDDSGAIPAERKEFINELKQALELEDQEAQEIIDEIAIAFSEVAEEEDLVDEEDSDAKYAEDSHKEYEGKKKT